MKLFNVLLATIAVTAIPGSVAKKGKSKSSKPEKDRKPKMDYSVKLMSDTSMCMGIDPNEDNIVRFNDCGSNKEYEEWYYKNGRIMNKNEDYEGWCFDGTFSGISGYPEMAPCSHEESSQIWSYEDSSFRTNDGDCLDFGDPEYGNMFDCDNDDNDQKYKVGRDFFEAGGR